MRTIPVKSHPIAPTFASFAAAIRHANQYPPMDCSAMITARRGKEVRQFFVNELGFYLYTPRQLILCFGCVYRTDTGDNLLYVHQDD